MDTTHKPSPLPTARKGLKQRRPESDQVSKSGKNLVHLTRSINNWSWSNMHFRSTLEGLKYKTQFKTLLQKLTGFHGTCFSDNFCCIAQKNYLGLRCNFTLVQNTALLHCMRMKKECNVVFISCAMRIKKGIVVSVAFADIFLAWKIYELRFISKGMNRKNWWSNTTKFLSS